MQGLIAGKAAEDRSKDCFGFSHPARSELTAGHSPLIGSDEGDAVSCERRQISLRSRVIPHAHIHRRGHENRLVGGQQDRSGQVIRQAVCAPGDQIGCGRGDDHQVGGPRELNVTHFCFVGQGKEVGVNLVLGQGGERQWGDELRSGAGQNRPHGHAGAPQQSGQFQTLVGGDTAPDDEQHAGLVVGQGGLQNDLRS